MVFLPCLNQNSRFAVESKRFNFKLLLVLLDCQIKFPAVVSERWILFPPKQMVHYIELDFPHWTNRRIVWEEDDQSNWWWKDRDNGP